MSEQKLQAEAADGQSHLADVLCTCCSCGWVGPRSTLAADYSFEAWSNTVCPACGTWDDIEDVVHNV